MLADPVTWFIISAVLATLFLIVLVMYLIKRRQTW